MNKEEELYRLISLIGFKKITSISYEYSFDMFIMNIYFNPNTNNFIKITKDGIVIRKRFYDHIYPYDEAIDFLSKEFYYTIRKNKIKNILDND